MSTSIVACIFLWYGHSSRYWNEKFAHSLHHVILIGYRVQKWSFPPCPCFGWGLKRQSPCHFAARLQWNLIGICDLANYRALRGAYVLNRIFHVSPGLRGGGGFELVRGSRGTFRSGLLSVIGWRGPVMSNHCGCLFWADSIVGPKQKSVYGLPFLVK